MPGATTASEVSRAAAMPTKLAMMPQTVPNRPMNGDTEEIIARLDRPPSAFISTSTWARVSFSATRARRSDTVSPGTAMRASMRAERVGLRQQRRLGVAHRAGKPRQAEQALDDENPAPHRGEAQHDHHRFADRPGLEEKSEGRKRKRVHDLSDDCRPPRRKRWAVAFPFGDRLPLWGILVWNGVGETAISIDRAIDKSNFGIGI